MFNQRLTTTDMRILNEPLGELFDEQTTAFKVNLGCGFILMQKQSSRFKYYHSSCNCCGRYLEEPALITNRADFDSFLVRIHESDILQWAITQRPNSAWLGVHVTNVRFFVNRILQRLIGCVGINLPTYVKRNKAVIGLDKDLLHIETICASSDVWPYIWYAKQRHCMPNTVIKTYMTLLVSRWTNSIELKPSSKGTYACISLSRRSKRRRRPNLSDVRCATTPTRCT